MNESILRVLVFMAVYIAVPFGMIWLGWELLT